MAPRTRSSRRLRHAPTKTPRNQDLVAKRTAKGRKAEPYTYQPLDKGSPQIRLLELRPGSASSPIVVSLSTVDFSLDRKAELQYEALSYTWGNLDNTTSIEVEIGKHKQHRFMNIPTNCYEALHALRYMDRLRTIWVDAICINQKDNDEKGHQVAMMADIYRKAAKVTAWLGHASENSEVAFEYMREVSSHVSVDPETHELVLLSEDSRWIEFGGNALIMEHQKDALAELLSRPWFSRVWIWQEIRLGDRRAVLKCGDFEILWSVFRAVMTYFDGKGVSGPSRFNLYASLETVSRLCDMRSWEFFDLLDAMRRSECSDPRDRVFAARSMVMRKEQAMLGQPDYTKPWQAVYSGLCVDIARRESRLDFLRFISGGREPGLPSWTPNWTSGTSGLNIHGIGLASGLSRCALGKVDERYLEVKGRLVATVRAVIPYGIAGTFEKSSSADCRTALIELLRSIGRHMTLHDGHEDLSALVKVLALGRYAEAYTTPVMIEKFQDFANAIRIVRTWPQDEHLFDEAVRQMPRNCSDAVHRILKNHSGMSFVFATDGKIGLAPRFTRPGDIIAVMLGCKFPMVLRPTVDANYEVIGPAYISGIMQGQSLLGPLPPHHSFLGHRHGAFRTSAFQDDVRNLTRLTDPRLPPLPSEWRYIGNLDDPGNWAFENMETGEKRMHLGDPRMDAEALEARGIQLDMIPLV